MYVEILLIMITIKIYSLSGFKNEKYKSIFINWIVRIW